MAAPPPDVFVLVRTDGRPPTNQSFHRVATCARMTSALRNATTEREVVRVPMEEAVGLPVTRAWGVGYGHLMPCSTCWPRDFVDAAFASTPLDQEKLSRLMVKHVP